MARVFVLGAGASRFAGYPLAAELWPFVRDRSGGHVAAEMRRQRIIKLIEGIAQKWVIPTEYDRPNLEEIFTYLDLSAFGSTLIELAHSDWKRDREELRAMISDAFMSYQYDLHYDSEASHDLRKTMHAWANFLQPGDVIVTFNWDILHERALWDAGKWHYADGYGFECKDSPVGAKSGIKILKVHGSVNWAQSNEQDCEPAVEHKADFFPGATDDHFETYMKGAGQGSEGKYLVVPSFLKDLSSNRLMLKIWNQAADAVAQADQLVVMGYSLHPADAPSRLLFGSGLLRNGKISKVFHVRPHKSVDHWDEFCISVGKYRKPIAKTFEEWVQNPALPS
jgi:hypothetical protein